MELFMKSRSASHLIAIFLFILFLFPSHNGYAQTQSPSQHDFQKGMQGLSKDSTYSNDSIVRWKQSREFAYMHYLDSLLRKEKNLKVDTVRIDESGRIKSSKTSSGNASGLNKILNSAPLKIFFWLLAFIFISFISYHVFFKNGFIGRRQKRLKRKNDENDPTGSGAAFDYDSLISEAENKKEFNLAIRYLFLDTLKTIADKELIEFSPEKTNEEYLREMENNPWFSEFQKLTYNYEFAWYGKFIINERKYEDIKSAFVSFNEKV